MKSAHHVEAVEERRPVFRPDPTREVDAVANSQLVGLRHQCRAQLAVTGNGRPELHALSSQQPQRRHQVLEALVGHHAPDRTDVKGGSS